MPNRVGESRHVVSDIVCVCITFQTGTRQGRSRVTRSLSYAPEVVYVSARTPCGPAELGAAHNPVLVERMLVCKVIHCITSLYM